MKRRKHLFLLAGVFVASSAMSCSWCPPQTVATPPVTVHLAVKAHQNLVPLPTGADVKAIATKTTQILNLDDTPPTDVKCQVELAVDSFGTFSGISELDSPFAWNLLFPGALLPTNAGPQAPAEIQSPVRQVRVIGSISWCGALVAASGCSWTNSIAVTRHPSAEGELWGHEVGHTKGLGHRSDLGVLMYEIIRDVNDRVNATECTSYRTKP